MKKRTYVFLFTLIAPVVAWSQRNDTVIYKSTIEEVYIKGYENYRDIMEIPGTVQLLEPEDLQKYDNTSVVRNLNTLPGVRMEQRSPGSYRISIRGSSLRAPFDVRNVKIYWNNVPLTNPAGITPLNLLDINQMGRIEILKGPAASVFGAGMGGVVSMSTYLPETDEQAVNVSTTAGSYGLQRYAVNLLQGKENKRVHANFAHQQSDGYREQTAFNRNVVQLTGKLLTNANHSISGSILYSDLFYEVPGGLTREQFNEDPTQARQPTGYFPGTVEQEAAVDYNALITSLTNDYQWSSNFKNTTSIYGLQSFFEMPFIADFERESRHGFGGRTVFDYFYNVGAIPGKLTAGGEFQRELLVGRNFENLGGEPGDISFDDEVRSWQTLAFFKTEWEFPSRIFLDAGVSFNDLGYNIYRLQDARLDTSYRLNKAFETVITPRIGILKQINHTVSIFGSIGNGFSPPSVKEVRTGDGRLNIDLQPETGWNYEAGVRLSINDRLFGEATFFYLELDETIVGYTEALSNTVRFRNAGATTQTGSELLARYIAINNPASWISFLELQAAYTYNHFRFRDYVKEEVDYSENKLTGTAPNILVASANVKTKPGLNAYISYNFTDEIPLNDANTVYSSAYQLVDVRVGWEHEMQNGKLEIFGGVNNLMDQIYSLGNDLNAYGERYYQPAPARNFYGGLKYRFGGLN
jgi:iron complex outermembrane receptor protein